MARLTEKQKRFVEEYLVDLNATQAAIRAGYAEKTADVQGPRLLGNVRVQEEIQSAMSKRSSRTEITQDAVLRELAAIGFAQATDFVQIRDNRVYLTETDRLTDEQKRAVAGIKEGKFGIELKLHDKIHALQLLGQHLGMFTGKEGQKDESSDDGFLDALKGEAAEVWQED